MKWRTFSDQDAAKRFIAAVFGVHAGAENFRTDLLADGITVGAVTTNKYSELYTNGASSWAVPITAPVESAEGDTYRVYRGSAKCWLAETIDVTTNQQSSRPGGYTSEVSYTDPWSNPTNCATTPLPVIIIAGQSNARGDSDGTESAALSNAGIPARLEAPETGQLEGTDTPINGTAELGRQYAVGDASNMGPEHALADHLLNNGYSEIGVIRVAYGSTNLAEDWDPDAVSGLQLYAALVNAIDRARTLWGNIEVVLVAWVQGESDAGTEAHANAYQTNLGNFIDSLTTDVDEVSSTTPWYIVYLNDYWDPLASNPVSRTYYSTVRSAQEAVVAARSNVYGVSMDDNEELQSGDEIHYTGAGRVTMGQRVGSAFTGA